MKTNYIPLLCSCICCKKEYTAKGIFSHFFSTHNNYGKELMAAIRQKGTAASFSNPEFQQKFNPTKIKTQHKCNNPTCMSITSKKYCSSSCAAIVNNSARLPESRKKQQETLLANRLKTGWTPKLHEQKSNKGVKYRTCTKCGKIDETIGHFQSDKCSFCNDSLTYRNSCKFTFNLKDYPLEFDLSLLTTLGMFHPKTNQKGVSRDHLLSVNYGKQNKIDPEILSHPANCQLIPQSKNKAKQHYSSITLEELLNRIKLWNIRYNDAGTGNAPISDQAYETCRVT